MGKGKCLEILVGGFTAILLALSIVGTIYQFARDPHYRFGLTAEVIGHLINFIVMLVVGLLTFVGLKKKNRFYLIFPLFYLMLVAIFSVGLGIYFTFFQKIEHTNYNYDYDHSYYESVRKTSEILRLIMFGSFVYYLLMWISMFALYKHYAFKATH